MNRLILILGLFGLFGAGLSAQDVLVADSVTIEAISLPATVTISAPDRSYVGDTLRMPFQILDADGQPTDGVTSWTVSDTSRAEIVSESETEVVLLLKRPGRVTLRVEIFRLTALLLGSELLDDGGEPIPGTFVFNEPRTIVVGQRAQACAVGVSDGIAIFASNPSCAAQVTLWGTIPDFRQALRLVSYSWAIERYGM